MAQKAALNNAVTKLVGDLKLPLHKEINQLRKDILEADTGLSENIKWNSPNYAFKGQDRITMRIQPPGKIQLIFHCGAKVTEQPKAKLVEDTSGLLKWKTNDRAVATYKTMQEIVAHKAALSSIIKAWLAASVQEFKACKI
jgi:hypothetical protein